MAPNLSTYEFLGIQEDWESRTENSYISFFITNSSGLDTESTKETRIK